MLDIMHSDFGKVKSVIVKVMPRQKMGRELAYARRPFFGGVFHGQETSGHSKTYIFQDTFIKIDILTDLSSYCTSAKSCKACLVFDEITGPNVRQNAPVKNGRNSDQKKIRAYF